MRKYLALMLLCLPFLGFSQSNYVVTFKVNTANITVGSNGIYLGGGVVGGANAVQLSDADGNGVYEGTATLSGAGGGNFIFLNSPANAADWGTKENLSGLPCADVNNYNDRILPSFTQDTTLLFCYESCGTDTVCPAVVTNPDVSFSVDMNGVSTSFTNVYVSGTLNSWSGNANQLTDPDGDGVYEGDITLAAGNYEFKFTYDNWAGQESLDATADSACTLTTGAFTNRYISIGSTDTILPTFCWEECVSCASTTPVACGDLFFSEYSEGSSNNKYIEIYNPTANAISFSGYTIYTSGNGGNFTNSFTSSHSIASGDVYFISTNQLDSATQALADTALGFPSIVHFNGDDALILVNGTDTIDVIGVPGVDPGSSWTVGTGSTANHTLVRKHSVNMGSTDWNTGASEWDVYAQNTWSYADAHASSCIIAPVDVDFSVDMNNVTASYTNVYVSGTINNWSGNANQLTDPDGDGVFEGTVSLMPGLHEYKFTYDNWAGEETLDATADSACTMITGIFTNRFITVGYTDTTLNTVCWEDCLACATVAASGCDELYFSEYIEGGSNNKAIELYNPTSAAISLSGYEVRLFSNGNTSGNVLSFPASASIPANGTYVIANSGSNAAILAVADTTSNVTYFNGDDALALMNGTDTLDILGVVGTDPGSEWTVGSGSTKDNTIVRKASVSAGTTDWSVSATQWDVHPKDTTMFLGAHTSNCASSVAAGCDELYFSEYAEGSSNNKYIEIYNPTGAAVSLSNYTVYTSGNGGSFTNTFTTNATIASGDVYMISTDQADASIQAAADTTLGYPSIVHFNGDDALILVSGTDTVDVIGVPGVDPGSSWTVDTGSTANHTLIRKASITAGSTDWTTGATEWDVYAQNTWTFMGAHTSNCVTVAPAPTFPDVVAISSFSSVDANGVADSLNATKWIKAVVTSIDFDGNGGYSFFVKDATDGMNIWNSADVSGYDTPTIGDSLAIRGTVEQYNGLTELKPDSIYLLNQGNPIGAPVTATVLDETTESEFIQLIGFEVVAGQAWPAAGSSANVSITNGTDTLTMRIDSDTDIDGSTAPAGMFDVKGLGAQFDSSNPYDEGYQIFPRMLTDIFEYPAMPLYNIADVVTVDADGIADSVGVLCKLEGTVLGVDMQGSATAIQFTIHDGTDGIGVYSSVPAAQSYMVMEGDKVRLIGSIGQFNGLTQLYADSITFISAGNTLPTATVVTGLNEATESDLVTFENATLVDPSQWTGSGSGFNVDITNGTDTIAMRIDNDVDLYSEPAPVGFFNVTGIGGQYDFSSPHLSGYQLLPRYIADITPATSASLPSIYVSEIMAGSNATAWNADWFEITNYGDSAVDLSGFSWDDESGISGTSVFPSVTLAAGEALVVWDDVAANEDSLLVSWKLNPGDVQVISSDELTGNFPSLSQNGDGVYLYDAMGIEITNSIYASATAGVTVEFDTTGAFTADAVDGVNGAYTSSLGDVGSPGNMTPNSNAGEFALNGRIYPNPTLGAFSIEMNQSDVYTVEVLDVRGALVAKTVVEGAVIPMKISAPAGMYLVRISSANGTATQRIQLH